MKAWELFNDGTRTSLRIADRPVPVPAADEVLVRLRAASLNYRDLAILEGRYPIPLNGSTVPLSDGAGEVMAVGSAVTAFAVGDRVVATFAQGSPAVPMGVPIDGVLQEYRLFRPDGLLHIPQELSFAEAATLPCAGVTAWRALFSGKILRPGETVLMLGTGGVSVIALQLARAAGARVIITSSSDEKLARARELGAHETINYRQHPEWEKRVLELTHGRGADHVVELGGAGTLAQSYQAVAANGEIALVGVITPPAGNLFPHPLMFKGATLRGIFVGGREYFEGLLPAITVNGIRPVIDSRYDFASAPQAFEHLRGARHFGKVVVEL